MGRGARFGVLDRLRGERGEVVVGDLQGRAVRILDGVVVVADVVAVFRFADVRLDAVEPKIRRRAEGCLRVLRIAVAVAAVRDVFHAALDHDLLVPRWGVVTSVKSAHDDRYDNDRYDCEPYRFAPVCLHLSSLLPSFIPYPGVGSQYALCPLLRKKGQSTRVSCLQK